MCDENLKTLPWPIEDVIYLAGYLDGEGCFWAYQDDHSLRYGIVCENTHRPTIEWIASTFGGSITQVSGKKENHRTTYRWAIVGKQARELAECLIPYLKEKANQAVVIIALHQTAAYPKLGRKVHPQVKEDRITLVKMIKEQKRVSW